MKKVKILVASVLFCAMGYAGYIVYERMTMHEVEKLIFANVEALTSGESGGSSATKTCYSYGYFDIFHDDYACEGQKPDDNPKPCKLGGFFRGHDDYKRDCIAQ